MIKVAKQLGCVQHRAARPEVLPAPQGDRPATAPSARSTWAPTRRSSRGSTTRSTATRCIKATRDAIDACAEFGYKNVICFTGMSEDIPDDVGADELRRGVQADPRPRREEGGDALPGDAQHPRRLAPDEGAPRLPGQPHRVLHRHHQAGRLAEPEAAVRHLPRPDHGRRRDPPASASTRTTSATSTPPATPAAASSTTTRRSPTSRSWRRSSRSATRATSARSSSRPATRSPASEQAVALCDV